MYKNNYFVRVLFLKISTEAVKNKAVKYKL